MTISKVTIIGLLPSVFVFGVAFAEVNKVDFEVASIRASQQPAAGKGVSVGARTDAARATYSFQSLRDLVSRAYGVDVSRISGGPGWGTADHWDVIATIPSGASPTQMPLMLQALLAARFGLEVSREAKEAPVYSLVPAKNGPKLKPSQGGDNPSVAATPSPGVFSVKSGGFKQVLCCGRAQLRNVSMTAFAALLESQTDRPVVDGTGIKGKFDISLEWTPEDSRAQGDGVTTPTSPSIYTAVQEQLGLKLQPSKASLDYLVIRRAMKPSEN